MDQQIYGEIQDQQLEIKTPINSLMGELAAKTNAFLQEVQHYQNHLSHDRSSILYEMANMEIATIKLLGELAVCFNSFEDAIRIQHMVNVKRLHPNPLENNERQLQGDPPGTRGDQ